MYILRILIVILNITLYPFTRMNAQIDVYTQQCATISAAQFSGSSTFNAGCYELPGSSGQFYAAGTQKEVIAENHILIDQEAEFTASGGGQIDLRIEPSPFDVVAYVPNLNSVPKLSKFELGLKPTQNIIDQIQNFLNETGSNELNPFMSDDIYIQATFTNEQMEWVYDNFPPTYELVETIKYRDGFYTKDVERDISGFEDLYSDPFLNDTNFYVGEDYDSLGGGWTISDSEYPFRIRFSPPKTGVWECDITIDINQGDEIFSLPSFSFDVVESNNKGYLSVDNNNRFFKRNGKSFMPLGLNYPWPGAGTERGYPLFTPGEDLVNPAQYYGETPPIAAYEAYLRKMDTLANFGANYFRMIMCPWSLDIEYEKLGDYSDRMHIAKEMDLILERAKANDMMIHWNLMIHFVFQDEAYGITAWDWTQHASDGSDLYCYRSDSQLQLEEPIEFFTSTLSKKYYKERLRYIVARWGYSPDIAVFEHFSEIDQIGGDGDGDNETIDYITEFYQDEIASWHEEMTNYLRDDLYAEQLISPSYTRAVDDPFSGDIPNIDDDNDYTFSLENIDMVNYNGYDYGLIASGDKYPVNFNFFRSYSGSSPLYDVMNLENENYTTGRGEYLKPVMYSEGGSPLVWSCDEKGVEITRGIYKSVFSGLAGYLEWDLQRKNYYFDFRPLANFLEGVDLESRQYHSGYSKLEQNEWIVQEGYTESSLSYRKAVDVVYLRSKDQNSAIGVITNRTYNYNTKGGCYGFTPDPEDEEWLVPYTYTFGPPTQLPNLGAPLFETTVNYNDEIFINNMKFSNYDIDYYSYNMVNNIIETSSDLGPIVKLEYPALDEDNWIVLFKAEKRNQKSIKNNEVSENEVQIKTLVNKNAISIYPNPTNSSVVIECNKKMEKIEVVDAMGRIILNKGVGEERFIVDLSQFERGIYYFNVLMETGEIHTKKVVRNE